MKMIALYLPQYHAIPENNEWWGENYTEWVALKKGKQYIEGQYQPRVPLNKNYYNLLNRNVQKWQIDLAKKYGISAFCVYHYWFDGKLLLEKPMENYLKDKSLDFPFFFCWDNTNWDTSWNSGKGIQKKSLIKHDFHNLRNVEKHFDYLLKFFKDNRYVKHNNKPVFVIYNPLRMGKKYLHRMKEVWDQKCKENGFDGICFLYQWAANIFGLGKNEKKLFDYGIENLPNMYDFMNVNGFKLKIIESLKTKSYKMQTILPLLEKIFKTKPKYNGGDVARCLSYDEVWNSILNYEYKDQNILPGAFTDWDNTPRYGSNGKVILGSTPEKFEKYLEMQIERAKKLKKDAIFIFAWNEWAEGGALEPDEKYKFKYLEAVKKSLEITSSFPKNEVSLNFFDYE